MIRIKPFVSEVSHCECGGENEFTDLVWQGLHICEKSVCVNCNKTTLKSLPVNQSALEGYCFFPESGLLTRHDGTLAGGNWFTEKLKGISSPVNKAVEVEIEIFKESDEVIILNTLDYIYGHSLLYMLNLQRLIKNKNKRGIVVIAQPMLRWLIPENDVAEIWTVNLGFREMNYYYPDLSEKINCQLNRFRSAWLSSGYVVPTNENIQIETFTGIIPYSFANKPSRPRITFIWREDSDRLWIRNIYLLKAFKKLGLSALLFPFHQVRVRRIMKMIRRKKGDKYRYCLAGLGKPGRFPDYIDDQRIKHFNEENERNLCKIYAESELVIGIHGSGMILPSAHAGMTISLMPSKRWGNFAEDLLYSENDVRLAAFQKRIIPLNINISEICDIILDMIDGRDYFLKKFIHGEEL